MNMVVVSATAADAIPGVFLDADAAVGRFEVEFALVAASIGVAVAANEVMELESDAFVLAASVEVGASMEESVPTPAEELVVSLAATAKLVLMASDVMV